MLPKAVVIGIIVTVSLIILIITITASILLNKNKNTSSDNNLIQSIYHVNGRKISAKRQRMRNRAVTKARLTRELYSMSRKVINSICTICIAQGSVSCTHSQHDVCSACISNNNYDTCEHDDIHKQCAVCIINENGTCTHQEANQICTLCASNKLYLSNLNSNPNSNSNSNSTFNLNSASTLNSNVNLNSNPNSNSNLNSTLNLNLDSNLNSDPNFNSNSTPNPNLDSHLNINSALNSTQDQSRNQKCCHDQEHNSCAVCIKNGVCQHRRAYKSCDECKSRNLCIHGGIESCIRCVRKNSLLCVHGDGTHQICTVCDAQSCAHVMNKICALCEIDDIQRKSTCTHNPVKTRKSSRGCSCGASTPQYDDYVRSAPQMNGRHSVNGTSSLTDYLHNTIENNGSSCTKCYNTRYSRRYRSSNKWNHNDWDHSSSSGWTTIDPDKDTGYRDHVKRTPSMTQPEWDKTKSSGWAILDQDTDTPKNKNDYPQQIRKFPHKRHETPWQ